MGIISNLVLKTAIKKALLDVTKEIESFSVGMENQTPFGTRVNFYLDCNPYAVKFKDNGPWEINFLFLIMSRASSEKPSSSLINNQEETNIFVTLINEWISVRGGNTKYIYEFASGNYRDNNEMDYDQYDDIDDELNDDIDEIIADDAIKKENFSSKSVDDNETVNNKLIIICKKCKTKNSILLLNIHRNPVCGNCKQQLVCVSRFDDDILLVTCNSCSVKNKIYESKINNNPICGSCKKYLLS